MTREEILAMSPGDDLDVLVAEKVMGWSKIIVDYHLINDPIDPFYKEAEADKLIEKGELVVGPNDSLMTPSNARWYKALERAEIDRVGEYYGKPGGSIIEADKFMPSLDIASAWLVVEKLSKQFRFDIGVAGGKRSEGDRIEIALWSDFWEQEFPDHLAVADTVPHAICLAALMTTLKEKHESADSR